MPLDHYLNAISGLDQTEEQCIKYELEKAGLFSHLSSFPLACLQFELTSTLTVCTAIIIRFLIRLQMI